MGASAKDDSEKRDTPDRRSLKSGLQGPLAAVVTVGPGVSIAAAQWPAHAHVGVPPDSESRAQSTLFKEARASLQVATCKRGAVTVTPAGPFRRIGQYYMLLGRSPGPPLACQRATRRLWLLASLGYRYGHT